jgi:hypothetical protein
VSAHVPATLGCNSALLALRKPQRFLLLGRTWQESRAQASAFRKSKFLIQKGTSGEFKRLKSCGSSGSAAELKIRCESKI